MSSQRRHPIAKWVSGPEASVVLVMIGLLIYLLMVGKLEKFAGPGNQDNIWRSIGMQSIIATGELLVILTGGIDLSVGSLVAFDGMLLAATMTRMADGGTSIGTATVAGVCVVLAFSLALGLVHAGLVHFLRLPPFVVTLASMSILRSAARLMNNAVPLPIADFELITFLGNGKLFVAGTGLGLPVSVVFLLVLGGLVITLLSTTPIGRYVYSVGSNEEASRLSGVGVFRVRMFVYCGCSLLAGVASILYTGYSAQGDPAAGQMYELNAISATVIGGAALTGGRGSVIGTILGAALLESILSTINLTLTNSTNWLGMVVGSVLLAAVVLNQVRLVTQSRRTGGAA